MKAIILLNVKLFKGEEVENIKSVPVVPLFSPLRHEISAANERD